MQVRTNILPYPILSLQKFLAAYPFSNHHLMDSVSLVCHRFAVDDGPSHFSFSLHHLTQQVVEVKALIINISDTGQRSSILALLDNPIILNESQIAETFQILGEETRWEKLTTMGDSIQATSRFRRLPVLWLLCCRLLMTCHIEFFHANTVLG